MVHFYSPSQHPARHRSTLFHQQVHSKKLHKAQATKSNVKMKPVPCLLSRMDWFALKWCMHWFFEPPSLAMVKLTAIGGKPSTHERTIQHRNHYKTEKQLQIHSASKTSPFPEDSPVGTEDTSHKGQSDLWKDTETIFARASWTSISASSSLMSVSKMWPMFAIPTTILKFHTVKSPDSDLLSQRSVVDSAFQGMWTVTFPAESHKSIS